MCSNTSTGRKWKFIFHSFFFLFIFITCMTNVLLCNIARHTTRLSATHLLLSPDGSRNLLANSTGTEWKFIDMLLYLFKCQMSFPSLNFFFCFFSSLIFYDAVMLMQITILVRMAFLSLIVYHAREIPCFPYLAVVSHVNDPYVFR